MFRRPTTLKDSEKKKRERIERARATRKATWYAKKLSKEVNSNGVKKSWGRS